MDQAFAIIPKKALPKQQRSFYIFSFRRIISDFTDQFSLFTFFIYGYKAVKKKSGANSSVPRFEKVIVKTGY